MIPPPSTHKPLSGEPLLRYWESPVDVDRFDPVHDIEGWAELIQLTATTLMLQEDEILPDLAAAQGFSLREARRALRGALGGFTRHALLALWEEEGLHLWGVTTGHDGVRSPWPRRTLVICGGAIPQPAIQAAAGALMVSGRVLVRPSRHDAFLLPLFLNAMSGIQAGAAATSVTSASRLGRLDERIRCATWSHDEDELTDRLVARSDSIVAFGDEPTLLRLGRSRRPESDFFAYGPRASLAVLDLAGDLPYATLERAMDNFADDVVAFDQRGCLSPRALVVIGGGEHDLGKIARYLADALDRRAREGGFAPLLPPGAAAAIQSLRAVYAMDPEGKRELLASPGLPGWTVLIDRAEPEFKMLPGYQTIRVFPAGNWDELLAKLKPWAGRLQAIGIGPDTAVLTNGASDELLRLGVSRVCPLGRMQEPPLEWTHDGNPFFPVHTHG